MAEGIFYCLINTAGNMTTKYTKDLKNSVLELDKRTDYTFKLEDAVNLLIKKNSDSAVVHLIKKTAAIIKGAEYNIEVKRFAKLVRQHLIQYYGFNAIQNLCKKETKVKDESKSLEELMAELNSLIGLEAVKSKVNELIAYQKIQKLRADKGLYATKNTLHLAFIGNPGTGKTTVARIVGHIYKQLGLLSKGHFLEVSRTDLIAGYQGQTALKVKNIIEQAKGGVLFIDEAYSITENNQSDSYGKECLTELTKALEDYRDDLVVIVAGYTEPMKEFFKSNPGLKSRFNTFIEFPDYNAQELEQILISTCKKNDYSLDKALLKNLRLALEQMVSNKGPDFANGRIIRNLYDDLVINHAKRVVQIQGPTKTDLSKLMVEDFRGMSLENKS